MESTGNTGVMLDRLMSKAGELNMPVSLISSFLFFSQNFDANTGNLIANGMGLPTAKLFESLRLVLW